MVPSIARSRYDVVIAGARVAGAATALLLARQGMRVLVVDPLPRGRDTLSTHALMRGGVLQLHRWGVLDRIAEAGTPALELTTFDYGDEVIPIPIKAKGGIDALYAPRRTVLDPILLQAAEDAGAEVVHGVRFAEPTRDARGRVDGVWLEAAGWRVRVEASSVVGADGVRSRVAESVDAGMRFRAAHTTASIYGYWPGLPDHEYRWFFRPGVGAGIIPTNDGLACVFVSVPPEIFRRERGTGLQALFTRALRGVDRELAERTASGAAGPLRAFAGQRGFVRRSSGPGWALVGDAGFFKDPLTAHGITDALRDAELLARALTEGTDEAVRSYEAQRDEVSHGLMEVTDRIASLEWDMPEVKALHHRLSEEMKPGTRLIETWDAPRGVVAV
ncbi:MAG TPA: FAD-dependent monooxygenase [Longimicrobiales bacterium]|nr:FAD-dependent monooxygenase [Longimicrobiales bacterium]